MARVNVAIQITSNYKGAPGIQKAEKDVNRLRQQVGRAANSVRAFQFVLAGVTISTLTIWGKKLVDVSSNLQLLQIRLNNVEGSAAAGAKRFDSLFETFRNAPFAINKVVDGFVRLRAAGIGSDQAQKTVEALVDAVALFGGTDAEFQRATIGFQQVAGKGVLSMEELRQQIGEAVPAAMAIMSREAGVSIATFVEQVKDGMVSAQDAFTFFTEGVQKQFGGFADSLAPTITGTIARVRNQITEAFKSLLDNTDILPRIAAAIQIIGDRIVAFIKSIDQEKVERFWRSFEGVAEVVWGIIRAIGVLLSLLGQIIGFIGRNLGSAAGSGLAIGIIGTMLFGTAPGVILGILGAIGVKVAEIKDLGRSTKEIDELSANLQPRIDEAFKSGNFGLAARLIDELQEAETAIKNSQFDLFGDLFDPKQFDNMTKDFAQRLKESQVRGVKAGILGLGAAAADLSEDILTLGDRAKLSADNSLTPWLKTIEKMTQQADALAARIGPLRKQISDDVKARQKEIDELRSEAGSDPKILALVDDLQKELTQSTKEANDSLRDMNGQLGRTRQHIKDLNASESEKFFLSMSKDVLDFELKASEALGKESPLQVGLKRLRGESSESALTLTRMRDAFQTLVDREMPQYADLLERTNALIKDNNLILDKNEEKLKSKIKTEQELLRLSTAKLRIDVSAQQRELAQQSDFGIGNIIDRSLSNEVASRRDELNSKIIEAEKELIVLRDELNNAVDPVTIENLKQQIGLWDQLRQSTIDAQAGLTEAALLQQELWKNVGDTIRNSVGNALEGVITGTKSLKEAGLDMWRALIKEASQYIAKLLFMKALGALSSAGGPSTLLPGFLGFANATGASFKGNIKPFADGGLIRGPTMFGLAGEAGTEAIMPLKRHGGKLGVSADGLGGDSYHISINAIDTQTGTKFLMDNMDTLVQGLQHQTSLNRGIRRHS